MRGESKRLGGGAQQRCQVLICTGFSLKVGSDKNILIQVIFCSSNKIETRLNNDNIRLSMTFESGFIIFRIHLLQRKKTKIQ